MRCVAENRMCGKFQTAFLVGGFAASPWLFAKLQERLKLLGLTLYKPNTHT